MDKGSAEIKIKLRNGIISVIHPEGNFKLAEWISPKMAIGIKSGPQ
jgi:hypothetical protein